MPLSELGIESQPNGFSAFSRHIHTQNAPIVQSKPTRTSSEGSEIIYLHIYEDPKFSLGIFCLPANAEIPLHNHPGMTVFSRVLYGTMHVTSYDLKDPQNLSKGAITVHDRDFTADDAPMSLFPTNGGNIHQFRAVTDCAVLDLLSPPYSTEDGRDCTYYRPVKTNLTTTAAPGVAAETVVLEECDPPENFVITSEHYNGLPVKVTSRERRHSQDAPRGDEEQEGETTTPSWSSGGSAGSPRSVTPPNDPPIFHDLCVEGEDQGTSDAAAAKAAALASKLESSHLSTSTTSPMNTVEGH